MVDISLTATPEQIVLGPSGAQVAVSVTNHSASAERIVVAVLAAPAPAEAEGRAASQQAWRADIDRPLRSIAAGSTEQFLVQFSAEAGQSGAYEARIIAYPADTAPEERPPSEQIVRLEIPERTEPVAAPSSRWWIAILLVALLAVAAAVAYFLLRSDEPEPPQPTPTPTATATATESPTSPPTETATASPTETVASSVDIQLFSLPECAVNGGSSDALTIFVAFRDGGPDQIDRLVPYTMVSDTGLSASGNAAISTGSAFSALQVGLLPSDYGITHTFTISADPEGVIPERDESNNTLRIQVELPSTQPSAATDVSCAIR